MANELDDDMKLIETSMAFANFGATRLDTRRGYEWKITFGVWALLAAGMVRGFEALPSFAGAFVLLAHGWWLRNVWLRHSSDANFMWHFVNQAQRLAESHGIELIPPKPNMRIGRGIDPSGIRKQLGFLVDWGLGFQFWITLGLTISVFATADRITWFEMALRLAPG